MKATAPRTAIPPATDKPTMVPVPTEELLAPSGVAEALVAVDEVVEVDVPESLVGGRVVVLVLCGFGVAEVLRLVVVVLVLVFRPGREERERGFVGMRGGVVVSVPVGAPVVGGAELVGGGVVAGGVAPVVGAAPGSVVEAPGGRTGSLRAGARRWFMWPATTNEPTIKNKRGLGFIERTRERNAAKDHAGE